MLVADHGMVQGLSDVSFLNFPRTSDLFNSEQELGGLQPLSDIYDIISEEDKVAVRMTQSGTHTGTVRGIPPTGKSFSVDYVHWFRLADGKVAELWAVRDDLTRLQQRGLITAPSES